MSEPETAKRLSLMQSSARAPAALIASESPPLFVLVLGMHRSGTSMCSHILGALGVDMSDDIEVNRSNAKGNWERPDIVRRHDAVLRLFHRAYEAPLHDLQLPTAWWAEPRVRAIQQEITECLRLRMRGAAAFGFKDPRTARLLPMWHQILRDLGVNPKIVLCLRNPAHVARSLQQRDSLDPEIGEYRWLGYMVEIFRNLRSYEVCTIEYEHWFDDGADNLGKLIDFLALDLHQSKADLNLTIAEIVDRELRHHRDAAAEPRQPLVRSFYKLVRRAGEDPAAREAIGYIVNQYVTFRQLQRPFERAFEQLAAASVQFEAAWRRVPSLESAIEERGAALAAVETELAALRGQLAERDVALAAADAELRSLRDELAGRNGQLDEASARNAARRRDRRAGVA